MSVEIIDPKRCDPCDVALIIPQEPVTLSAVKIGTLLAEMDAEQQATILLEGLKVTENWWWAMQCRNIVDLLKEDERQRIAAPLETLVDHLRENSRVNAVRPILTRHVMPEVGQHVIVAGGVAVWNGTEWLSGIRPIQWPVLWWMPLLQDEDVLDASERPGPPCQV